jgi:predicted nicotinamide N-methyase
VLLEFIHANTALAPAPFVPEITLHQAAEPIALWEKTEESGAAQPPPFWAFAWAGGQALARHILDHPDLVSGRAVLDLATPPPTTSRSSCSRATSSTPTRPSR